MLSLTARSLDIHKEVTTSGKIGKKYLKKEPTLSLYKAMTNSLISSHTHRVEPSYREMDRTGKSG